MCKVSKHAEVKTLLLNFGTKFPNRKEEFEEFFSIYLNHIIHPDGLKPYQVLIYKIFGPSCPDISEKDIDECQNLLKDISEEEYIKEVLKTLLNDRIEFHENNSNLRKQNQMDANKRRKEANEMFQNNTKIQR